MGGKGPVAPGDSLAGRRAFHVKAAGQSPLSAGNCRIGSGGGYLNFAAACSNDS